MPPAVDVTLRPPLRLVLLAVVLALSVAGHAHALVTVNAVAFLADCGSPITVTQDTRVTGSATVTNSCTIDVDPGVTLEFSSAIITASDLSIDGGIGATVRLVNSRVQTVSGPLDIDLLTAGGTGSLSVTKSTLISFDCLTMSAPGAVNVTGSVLSSGCTISVESEGPVAISGSQLQAALTIEITGAPVSVAGSALSTGDAIGIISGGSAVVTISNSKVETTAVDSVIGILADAVSVTGSTLLTDSSILLIAFNGAAAITNSRLQATQADMLVFGETDNTVTGSALIAGGGIGVAAGTGAAAVRNSRLEGSEIGLGGATDASVTGSALLATGVVDVFADPGTATVRNSQVQSKTETISVSGASGTTVAGSELTATDFVSVEAGTGIASVSNSRLRSTTTDVGIFGDGGANVISTVLTASLGTIFVETFGPIIVRSSQFVSVDVEIVSNLGTTSVTLSDFTGVTGTITISGTAGCTTSGNVPTVTCS